MTSMLVSDGSPSPVGSAQAGREWRQGCSGQAALFRISVISGPPVCWRGYGAGETRLRRV